MNMYVVVLASILQNNTRRTDWRNFDITSMNNKNGVYAVQHIEKRENTYYNKKNSKNGFYT